MNGKRPRPDVGADGDCLGTARSSRHHRAIGARNVDQLDDSLDAVKKLQFTDAELKEIDRFAEDSGIDLWKDAREGRE